MQPSTPLSQLAAEMLEGGRLYCEKVDQSMSGQTYGSLDHEALKKQIDAFKSTPYGTHYSFTTHGQKGVNVHNINILSMLYVFSQGLEESLRKPLEGRVEEMKKAQELTLHQIVTGGIPEMNAMIEAVVTKKLEALKLTPEQKADEDQAKQPIRDVLEIQAKIFQDLDSAGTDEEKLSKIQVGVAKISHLMKDFQAKTDAEKALERLVALVSECNKLKPSTS